MGLAGTVSLISNANQIRPEVYADWWTILAVGENKVFILFQNAISSINLSTGATAKTAHSIDIYGCVLLSSGMSKSGYLDFKILHTTVAEAQGSKHLYLTHARMDTSTLAIVSSSTTLLSGPLLNDGPGRMELLSTRGDIAFCGGDSLNYLLAVNLNNLTYWKTATGGHTGAYYMFSQTWLADRTTHKPYIFWGQHYWIVGSQTSCGIYDPATDTMTSYTTFNANSGAVHWPKLYEDSSKKLHFIYTATSSTLVLGARYSKYYLMYVDNGVLTSEITPVGGSAYTSGTCADISPLVLGVTPDNTLALATQGSIPISYITNNSPAFTAAVDLIECTDLLDTPTKIAMVTDAVPANSNVGTCGHTPVAFLLQSDWSYRIPLQMYPYDPSTQKGTMKIAKIILTTDIKPNPYVVLVPP